MPRSYSFNYLFLLTILFVTADLSAQSNLSLDISAGFNDKYKSGKIVPFNVTIHRGSAELTKAELEKEYIKFDLVIETRCLSQRVIARIPNIRLSRETSKKFAVYVPMIESEATAYLQVGWRKVAKKNIILSRMFDDDYLVLAIGSNGEALGALPSLKIRLRSEKKEATQDVIFKTLAVKQLFLPEIYVCSPEPKNLPSVWSGYEAVSLIIFANFDETQLSQAQKDAIENWVLDGGHVVILGGQMLGQFSAIYQSPNSLIGKLLPGKIEGTQRQRRFVLLKKLLGISAPDRDAIITVLTPHPDAKVLSYVEDGSKKIPLLVKNSYGLGKVMFVAFDSTRPPFGAWNQRKLWEYIIKELGDEYADTMNFQSKVQNAAMNLPVTQLPSIFLIGGFLVIYMIALGPANYFILKRLDKRSLLWLTMPATILLFLTAAYVMGLALRGRVIILNKITIAKFAKGKSHGTARTYIGLFSPRGRRYDLDFGPNSETVRALDYPSSAQRGTPLFINYNTEGKEGKNISVTKLSVAKWTMRMLQVDHVMEFPDWLEVVIGGRNANVLKEVRNNSDKLLEQCVVGDSKRIAIIGDVPPKGVLKPNLLLQSGRPKTDWFERPNANALFIPVGRKKDPAAPMKRELWYAVFSRGNECLNLSSLDGPYFACLIEKSPIDVSIRNRKYIIQNLTLLIYSLGSNQVSKPKDESNLRK